MVTYPNDWKDDKVSNLVDISTGYRDTQDSKPSGKFPFFVRSPIVERIDVADYDCEAVLTAGDGVGTGKVFHYINGKFAAHQRVYVMNNFRDVDGKYFYYYFSKNFITEVEKYTAKSSVDSVRRAMIADMQFPHPEIPEQKEIVDVLSSFDAYIDDLAELIEKKKGIRDGAINDLLSGNTRLKGFDKSWKETTLGNEFEVIMGSSPNSASYNSSRIGVPLVQGNADIVNRVTAPKRYTSMPTKICEIGDTILTVRAPVGSASRANQRVCLGRGVCAISGSHKDFIYYLMRYHESAWESIEQGSTFTAVSGKEVRKFEIKIPQEGREQDAIASILTAMDEEIRNLETEREKIIQIREGAMEDLLTGRVRLTT